MLVYMRLLALDAAAPRLRAANGIALAPPARTPIEIAYSKLNRKSNLLGELKDLI